MSATSMLAQSVSKRALTDRASPTSSAARETLQNLRKLLYDSAATDGIRVCDFSKDPAGTFYPYGYDVECRIRHARAQNSAFRQGIHWVFQHHQSTGQRGLSDEMIGPITQLLVEEAKMSEPEALQIVLDHYSYVYGSTPSMDIRREPSRAPQVVIPAPHEGRPPDAPLPMPGLLPGDEAGAGCPPGHKMTIDGQCVPCQPADSDPQCYAAAIQKCELEGGSYDMTTAHCKMPVTTGNGESEFPWMWVGIGAGALVLVGGAVYLATKGKGP